MSFSDETPPSEEVTPEPDEDADATWSDADAAAVEAEAKAAADGGASDPMTKLTAERDEYLLALQRTQADFENYRKRITRLQEEQSARAASDLVSKLLPVLDTLDLAKAHQSEASAGSDDAKALNAARSMLLDLLAKEGLERVDESGVPFDPMVHDAVSRSEPDPAPNGAAGSGAADGDGAAASGGEVIDQVLRSGYRWRGQVLRPAMVSVRG